MGAENKCSTKVGGPSRVTVVDKWLALLATGIVLILGGCGGDQTRMEETRLEDYQRGKDLLRTGRYQEALGAFLAVVAARPDAPQSNLEAGLIYLNHINDPITAIYHFRKYLEFHPQGEQSELVRELITTAKKDFARTLPGQPIGASREHAEWVQRFEALQQENLSLKRELAASEERVQRVQAELAAARQILVDLGHGSLNATDPDTTERLPTIREQERRATYVVKSGDTLTSISESVYGSPSRWMDIFRANRSILRDPNDLKPGQELVIP